MFLPITKNDNKSGISRLKWAEIQILAGSFSSIVEVLTLMPLDVVKTRLQLQTSSAINAETHYKGVFDAFSNIYRQEGLFAFWRGIIPPFVSDTPRRAVKFMVFEQLQPFFLFGAPNPTVFTYSLCGAFAGMIEAVLQNSFEVIKITQQANRKNSLSTLSIARSIFRTHGFGPQGFRKGVGATVCRNGIFHIVYFGLFCTVRDSFVETKNPIIDFSRKGGLAVTSGLLGCVCCIPFDVAKSRIQGPQPVAGEIKYSRVFSTISTIYREEGFRALFKGLTPQLMRGGPGGAILLLTYEYMTNFWISKLT